MYIADKNQVGIDGNLITPEQFKFNLTCTCCGSSKVRLVPASYYDKHTDDAPSMVTNHIICMNCRNNIEFIILDRRKKNQSNGDR